MNIQRLNELLYDSKEAVLKGVKVTTFFAALVAIILIVLENGYHLDADESSIVHNCMSVIFGVFSVGYFIRLLYDFERIEFIKSTWIEGSVMTLIIVSGVSYSIFGIGLFDSIFRGIDFRSAQHWHNIFVTLMMLYLVGFEFVKVSSFLSSLTIKPATTFILSFIVLIGIGTGALMLPQMTIHEGGAPFMTAFFTSVSASCVTGLIVEDTATYFTYKGHWVIMVLIQLGGIGIVSFATFFALFLKNGVGLKQQLIIQDFLSTDSLSSAKTLLSKVVGITLTIEAISAFCIFFTWGSKVQFASLGMKVFHSIFHAVSAFCNAGFSLYSNGLYETEIRGSLLLHVVIAFTVIMGGLGFSVIEDVFSIKSLRERLEKPWKDWKLGSKVAIHTSMVLIVIGTFLYFMLEQNTTLKGLSTLEMLVAAFFQSVSTRTAGFNTVDFSLLTNSTLIFMIFLMFIGASSGSTGGGVKTSTFLLISISSIATIKGKKNVELGKNSISNELLFKAFSIFVFAATFNLIMIFLLSITEPNLDILKIVFEQVSAFATVGLSAGITAKLSVAGQSLIILSMFVGRIGTLTLALALSSRVSTNAYRYPNAHIMIG
ncbi:MAG: ATPase [Cytophagales bacterium]|nr:ATPase [Cytophagales bacterium]